MSDKNPNETVADLAADNVRKDIAAASKFSAEQSFMLVPEGYTVENMREHAKYLDERLAAPRRLHKRMRFVDVSSFLVYFQQFRVGHRPQLFHKVANDGMHIMGVFDYDESANQEADGAATQAKWGDNVAYLKLAYSRDYQQLRNLNDKWFTQQEFALFVEENTHLFVQPDAATMYEMAQQLKGSVNAEWKAGERLANGARQFQYLETIDAQTVLGDPVVVPEYLMLRLPMYEGMSDQDIKLAFRWRLDQHKQINFSYRLLTKVAERKAEEEVKQRITGTTSLELLTVSSFDGLTPHRLD